MRVDDTGGLSAIDNPGGWVAAVYHSFLLTMLAFSIAFIGRQVLSWRRSAGERRQQLKWLASGAAVTMVSVVLAAAWSAPGPTTGLREWAENLAWFGIAALPVSMGVGILKYRLYEIDRIISRTLAYAVVTGLLIGVYAGLVLLSNDVLSLTSPVAVAASTLIAAASFNPLRRRVQRIVDRRFNRARYDAEVTVAAFAARRPKRCRCALEYVLWYSVRHRPGGRYPGGGVLSGVGDKVCACQGSPDMTSAG